MAKVMARFGIEHHILTWEGDKPTTAVEETARAARYQLLGDWCKAHGIRILAVGHHRRDQAETFLLRLQRGSGLYGLSGMQPLSRRGGLIIIRPQLEDNPDDLRAYLQQKNVDWVEDESNCCDDFQRVKIRKFLPELACQVGITEERLAATAAVLARSRAYFEAEVSRLLASRVRQWGKTVYAFAPGLMVSLPDEIAYRLLAEILCLSGGQGYAPEAEEVLRLLADLRSVGFRGATLGGCEVFPAQKRIWVVPEHCNAAVLSKAEWEKCLQFAPQYANSGLPYKVRRALYNEIMKVSNGQES